MGDGASVPFILSGESGGDDSFSHFAPSLMQGIGEEELRSQEVRQFTKLVRMYKNDDDQWTMVFNSAAPASVSA